MTDDLYWDPFDWELHADPHPVWRRMREEAPLYRNDRYDFWALTRFHDVSNVLVDHETYTSARATSSRSSAPDTTSTPQSLLSEDPPLHTVHRHLLSRAFTPRAIKTDRRPRPRVRAAGCSTSGSDRAASTSSTTTAPASPGMVIAAMLGTPDSDLD